ncbi:MAG: rhodanese-like domain-containing protein [Planctomycetota bacterium]
MSFTSESSPSAAAALPGKHSGGVLELAPHDAQRRLQQGQAILVDVREPDEHARERIEGSRLMPLSRFDIGQLATWIKSGQRVIVHCKSGRCSADACRMAATLADRGIEVVSLAGGIEAWKAASLPVTCSKKAPAISIMRQVQLVIGACVLGGSALAWFVDPRFIAIPAFFGAGLAFAGATGTCALASLIGWMPWNRIDRSGGSCCSGS